MQASANQMPSDRPRATLADLDALPADLEFECLPAVPQMRAILEHSARRCRLAFEQRARVSAVCALPVVDLPFRPDGFTAESGWTEDCEAILAQPEWPDVISSEPPRYADGPLE